MTFGPYYVHKCVIHRFVLRVCAIQLPESIRWLWKGTPVAGRAIERDAREGRCGLSASQATGFTHMQSQFPLSAAGARPTPDAPSSRAEQSTRPPSQVRRLLDLAGTILFKTDVPESGRRFVLDTIERGPSRKVQSGSSNTIAWMPSRKTGLTHGLESRRGETAAAILLEHDPKVLGFSEQAQPISLRIENADGRVLTTTPYTADFVVLREDGITVMEVRDEGKLVSRFAKNPWQFYRDENNRWRYRAAEEEFRRMGLSYQIVSNSEIPSALVLNAEFLEDYLLESCPALDPRVAEELHEFVEASRFVPMRTILDTGCFSADSIFQAIASGHLYVDLKRQRLDITDELTLFVDEATAQAHALAEASNREPPLPIPGTVVIRAGSQLTYHGTTYKVLLSSERDVSVMDAQGQVTTLPLTAVIQMHDLQLLDADGFRSRTDIRQLADRSPEELARAYRRLEALRDPNQSAFDLRSLQRFSASIRGAQTPIDELLALCDEVASRGNRTARLPVETEELAVEAIKLSYNTPEERTKTAAFAKFLELCRAREEKTKRTVIPMSYPTFCKRCDDQIDIRKRSGKRVAYQKAVIAQQLEDEYPVHGVREYQICHIDHTTANMATVAPTGMELGKPTLTVACDGCTAMPKAMVLTYDPPSVRTVFLVLRDYVRRHRRLPDWLVLDNGPEFRSEELQIFCNYYRIKIRRRVAGEPRGGTLIERMIESVEEEVFQYMQGNTIKMKDPRLVTASVNPFNRAVWTLPGVYGAVDEYLFKDRPNRVHPELGVTPNEFALKRIAETGVRAHRLIRFDENLMLMTSPHSRRHFHKLDDRRGIWADGQWYRHPEMTGIRKGTKLEVRIEPWVFNVIYVQLKGRWVAAIGTSARKFHGRTRREVEIACRQAKRLANVSANRDRLTPRALQNKENLLKPEHYDARLHVQQQEMAYLYAGLNMTQALPVDALPRTASPSHALAPVPGLVEAIADAVLAEIPAAVDDVSSGSGPDVDANQSKYDDMLSDIDGLYF